MPTPHGRLVKHPGNRYLERTWYGNEWPSLCGKETIVLQWTRAYFMWNHFINCDGNLHRCSFNHFHNWNWLLKKSHWLASMQTRSVVLWWWWTWWKIYIMICHFIFPCSVSICGKLPFQLSFLSSWGLAVPCFWVEDSFALDCCVLQDNFLAVEVLAKGTQDCHIRLTARIYAMIITTVKWFYLPIFSIYLLCMWVEDLFVFCHLTPYMYINAHTVNRHAFCT